MLKHTHTHTHTHPKHTLSNGDLSERQGYQLKELPMVKGRLTWVSKLIKLYWLNPKNSPKNNP